VCGGHPVELKEVKSSKTPEFLDMRRKERQVYIAGFSTYYPGVLHKTTKDGVAVIQEGNGLQHVQESVNTLDTDMQIESGAAVPCIDSDKDQLKTIQEPDFKLKAAGDLKLQAPINDKECTISCITKIQLDPEKSIAKKLPMHTDKEFAVPDKTRTFYKMHSTANDNSSPYTDNMMLPAKKLHDLLMLGTVPRPKKPPDIHNTNFTSLTKAHDKGTTFGAAFY
jgi:hypothetical protein